MNGRKDPSSCKHNNNRYDNGQNGNNNNNSNNLEEHQPAHLLSRASTSVSEFDTTIIPLTTTTKNETRFSRSLVVVALVAIVAGTLHSLTQSSSQPPEPPTFFDAGPNTVYVSGGGYSGFWYLSGRMQALVKTNPSAAKRKDYYCYSAGCWAVGAALGRFTIDEMLDSYQASQKRYRSGEIDSREFLPDVLTNVFGSPKTKRLVQNKELLSRIHVITTIVDSGSVDYKNMGYYYFSALFHPLSLLKPNIRSPVDYASIVEIFLETAWLPHITGNGWVHENSQTGQYHLDGIITKSDHPACEKYIHMPSEWRYLSNMLTIDMDRELMLELFNAGYRDELMIQSAAA